MSIEDREIPEMSVDELVDYVEEDDIPTSDFTVEDTDRMVILGKLNAVLEWLKTHGYGTNIFSNGEYLENYNIDLKLDKSVYDAYILALDEILQDIATALEDIPTKTSELDNDSGFITLADIPTIPTKTSDLLNDSGFITDSYHDSTKQDVLTFDDTPTVNSQNPVTSGGVYDALQLKQDKINVTHQKATANTTYVQEGECWYYRIGNTVYVQIENLTFKAVNQPHGATIVSGLPTAIGTFTVNISAWGQSYTTRLRISSGSTELKNYWDAHTPSTSGKYSAYFFYITRDN